MPQFKVNVRGRIVQGRWAGQHMTIEDDTAGGGYLILIEADVEGKNAGDVWIEKSEIDKAFKEAGWEIEWEAAE